MVRYCAICTENVTNENIKKDGYYFCTNECEMEYCDMSLGNRRILKKVRELSEKTGMYMHFDNFRRIVF